MKHQQPPEPYRLGDLEGIKLNNMHSAELLREGRPGVYSIQHGPTGLLYVGTSYNTLKRLKEHLHTVLKADGWIYRKQFGWRKGEPPKQEPRSPWLRKLHGACRDEGIAPPTPEILIFRHLCVWDHKPERMAGAYAKQLCSQEKHFIALLEPELNSPSACDYSRNFHC